MIPVKQQKIAVTSFFFFAARTSFHGNPQGDLPHPPNATVKPSGNKAFLEDDLQESYNTPRYRTAHSAIPRQRQLCKDSLYNLLVKVFSGCVPKVCWNNLGWTMLGFIISSLGQWFPEIFGGIWGGVAILQFPWFLPSIYLPPSSKLI